MPYEVNDEISTFLPPNVISVHPLEFDWAEATNAILFTSNFDPGSYSAWVKTLSEHFTRVIGDASQVMVEDDDELGTVSVWMTREKGGHPMSNIQVDSHWAYTKTEEAFENLNSWIGSELLTEMNQRDTPATIGMVRFRPET